MSARSQLVLSLSKINPSTINPSTISLSKTIVCLFSFLTDVIVGLIIYINFLGSASTLTLRCSLGNEALGIDFLWTRRH